MCRRHLPLQLGSLYKPYLFPSSVCRKPIIYLRVLTLKRWVFPPEKEEKLESIKQSTGCVVRIGAVAPARWAATTFTSAALQQHDAGPCQGCRYPARCQATEEQRACRALGFLTGTANLARSGAHEGPSTGESEMLCSVQLALGSPASGGSAAPQDQKNKKKPLFSSRVQLNSLPPVPSTDVREKHEWLRPRV